jgi:hypothetical protein
VCSNSLSYRVHTHARAWCAKTHVMYRVAWVGENPYMCDKAVQRSQAMRVFGCSVSALLVYESGECSLVCLPLAGDQAHCSCGTACACNHVAVQPSGSIVNG